MGYTNDGVVKFANAVDVFDVRRLHEGVDAREVGQFTSGEGGDVAVNNAVGSFQAEAMGLVNLLLPTREWQGALLFESTLAFCWMRTIKGARST